MALTRLSSEQARQFVRTKLLEKYGTLVRAADAIDVDYHRLLTRLRADYTGTVPMFAAKDVGVHRVEQYVTREGEAITKPELVQRVLRILRSRGQRQYHLDDYTGMRCDRFFRNKYKGAVPPNICEFAGVKCEIFYTVESPDET